MPGTADSRSGFIGDEQFGERAAAVGFAVGALVERVAGQQHAQPLRQIAPPAPALWPCPPGGRSAGFSLTPGEIG